MFACLCSRLIFIWFLFVCYSKQELWVLARTILEPFIETVLKTTHNLCCEQKIEKIYKTSSPKGNDAHLRTSIFK